MLISKQLDWVNYKPLLQMRLTALSGLNLLWSNIKKDILLELVTKHHAALS